jgi:hypothetical protein
MSGPGRFEATMVELRTHFARQWDLVADGAPVVYGRNQTGFKPPTEGPWARMVVNDDDVEYLAAGAVAERTKGSIMVEIFVPYGEDEQPGRALGDSVAAIWRGNPIPGIRFWPTSWWEVQNDGVLRDREPRPFQKYITLTNFNREYYPEA